jgi:hypothetical protein
VALRAALGTPSAWPYLLGWHSPRVVETVRSDGLTESTMLGVATFVDDILAHAEYLSSELEVDMSWSPPESGYKGFWQAQDGTKLILIRARANRAIAFLDRHAGAQSQWTTGARAVLQSSGENQSMESGARGVGELLRFWVDEVRRGFTSPNLADEFGSRTIASTDLMEQVRTLLVDRKVHPAVPDRSHGRRIGNRVAIGDGSAHAPRTGGTALGRVRRSDTSSTTCSC